MTIEQIAADIERIAIQLGASGLIHYERELLEIAEQLRRLKT